MEGQVRWKVGSDHSIRLWGSSWLSRSDNFYLQTPPMSGFEHKTVNDLMCVDTGRWNRNLIDEIFIADDAKAILRTPISPSG